MGHILVGCEESQKVTQAFRKAGHEAVSCDILSTRGDPDYHIQADIMEAIPTRRWDLIIVHPECTAMALSGNRWYGHGMPRHSERLRAIQWTLSLWAMVKRYTDRAALENPASVFFKQLPEETPVNWIQPWEFGHGETKRTGLALHNLPRLTPTRIVTGRESRVHRMPPSATRKRDRSTTYSGIAEAMAVQWGAIL